MIKHELFLKVNIIIIKPVLFEDMTLTQGSKVSVVWLENVGESY